MYYVGMMIARKRNKAAYVYAVLLDENFILGILFRGFGKKPECKAGHVRYIFLNDGFKGVGIS